MRNKRKKVIVSQKLYPNQINELAMCCFIIKKDKLDKLYEFIANNGGRVISAISSKGYSRASVLEVFDGEGYETWTVLAMCQKEIVEVFMLNICREFEFNKKGKGKAVSLDVLGFMGAKGPFVE